MDNDHTPTKVALRVEAVERLGGKPREIRVLDAYHGHGKLWPLVQEAMPEWSFKLYRSDMQRRAAGTLKIDNARLLEALDLSKFDLIDLDAYGFPAKQLKLVSKRAPTKMVLTTRITRTLGSIPRVILEDLGFTIPKGAPHTLFVTLGDELWEAWLYRLGYRETRVCTFDHFNGEWRDSTHQIKRYELLIPG